MIALNHRDGKPIYQQIIDGFRHHIALGILEPDEKLPVSGSLPPNLPSTPTPSNAPTASWRPRD
ncbi:MAG: hypothetical protein R3Y62_02650 [Eubacteriales bacterium]